MLKKCLDFLREDIWRVNVGGLSKGKAYALEKLRIFFIALRGFKEDACPLRASALTFFTLLSIVPMVAMAFGIAKGFGFEKMLEKVLYEQLAGQGEAIEKIILFSQQLLENTKGGLVAGIGVAILFWTVIKVLGNIEKSFNAIWGIKKDRHLGRKFSDYLAIMLICPLLFIISSSLTVYVTSFLTQIIEKMAILGPLGGLFLKSMKFAPYLVIWFLFSFIYVAMPNTKVKIKSGLVAGVIAGTIYQLVQWAYIAFQIGVAKFNAIYGSFAALPLFLVWLQISWLIVLFGAEIAYAHQNAKLYEHEPDCRKASFAFLRLCMLNSLTLIVKRFVAGDEALSVEQLAEKLGMPIRLMRDVLFKMTECGLVSELCGDEDEEKKYHPAEDPDKYSISFVLDRVGMHGVSTIPVAESKELETLQKSLQNIHKGLRESPDNVYLKDI